MVLLHNDGILPLDPSKKVALIGPSWAEPRSYMGCYSFTNHVLSRYPGDQLGLEVGSLDAAVAGILDDAPVLARGCGFVDGTDEELAEAVAAATAAEVAVLTVGDVAGLFGVGTSGEGCDVVDLALPGRQAELVDAVLATGTPTILVAITGRPYALGEYADRAAAILQCFMPGVEGSHAISGVLSGELNPSGRLPIAIPLSRGGQPAPTSLPSGLVLRGHLEPRPRPKWPFGFGSSTRRSSCQTIWCRRRRWASTGRSSTA